VRDLDAPHRVQTAVAARTFACTGDSTLADDRYLAIADYPCRWGDTEVDDPSSNLVATDMTECVAAIQDASCDDADLAGDDPAFWLHQSDRCLWLYDAVARNVATYGVLASVDRNLQFTDEEPVAGYYEYNLVADTLRVPGTRCDETVLGSLDVSSLAMGFGGGNHWIRAFYAFGATGHVHNSNPYQRSLAHSDALWVGAYGIVAPFFGPTTFERDHSVFVFDYMAGVELSPGPANLTVAYIGSRGLYVSGAEQSSQAFARLALDEGLSRLPWWMLGVARLPWPESRDGEPEIRWRSLLLSGESEGERSGILDERPLGRATSEIPIGLSSAARRSGWNPGRRRRVAPRCSAAASTGSPPKPRSPPPKGTRTTTMAGPLSPRCTSSRAASAASCACRPSAASARSPGSMRSLAVRARPPTTPASPLVPTSARSCCRRCTPTAWRAGPSWPSTRRCAPSSRGWR